MTYREWHQQVVRETSVWSGPFWDIIDRNWTPDEQNRLAREWKSWRGE